MADWDQDIEPGRKRIPPREHARDTRPRGAETIHFFALFRVDDRFFFPPPDCLFTVAHARAAAVFFETPRFS
jgi:hypothetical protein